MIYKKAQMKGILGALLITIVLTVVAVYIIFMWLGGFIPHEENVKQTAMNMAEIINFDIKGCGSPRMTDFDVNIFPDYALVASDGEIRVMHRNLEEDCSKKDACKDGTCVDGVCIEQVGAYPYETSYFFSDDVCSPYSKDKSTHTTHCPDSLIINMNWENKIIRKYCICAFPYGEIYPKPVRGKIVVYPKGHGVFCYNILDDAAEWGAKKTSDKARDLGTKAYDKLKGAFEDEE